MCTHFAMETLIIHSHQANASKVANDSCNTQSKEEKWVFVSWTISAMDFHTFDACDVAQETKTSIKDFSALIREKQKNK